MRRLHARDEKDAGSEPQEPVDPWPAAEQEIFTAARAWAKNAAAEDAVTECQELALRLNDVEGSHFLYLCEQGREMAMVIARYLSLLRDDEEITRKEILEEIDVLEMAYIEESVLAEQDG